jgi:hypothetical protein
MGLRAPLCWPALPPLGWQCGIVPPKNFPILIGFGRTLADFTIGAGLTCLHSGGRQLACPESFIKNEENAFQGK